MNDMIDPANIEHEHPFLVDYVLSRMVTEGVAPADMPSETQRCLGVVIGSLAYRDNHEAVSVVVEIVLGIVDPGNKCLDRLDRIFQLIEDGAKAYAAASYAEVEARHQELLTRHQQRTLLDPTNSIDILA